MNLNDYLLHWDGALEGGVYKENYAEYLSLNRTRFNRNYKTFKASEEFVKVSQRVSIPTNWIIITEPWCGDAAQSVPILLKLIHQIPNAGFTLELRDQSTLIDQYLTNGGKGIPKVIVRDAEGNDLLVWGPRTREAQELFNGLKAEGVELKVLHESLHGWYAKDQGKSLELELLTLIQALF
jgi:glutaredoxin-related protein